MGYNKYVKLVNWKCVAIVSFRIEVAIYWLNIGAVIGKRLYMLLASWCPLVVSQVNDVLKHKSETTFAYYLCFLVNIDHNACLPNTIADLYPIVLPFNDLLDLFEIF